MLNEFRESISLIRRLIELIPNLGEINGVAVDKCQKVRAGYVSGMNDTYTDRFVHNPSFIGTPPPADKINFFSRVNIC